MKIQYIAILLLICWGSILKCSAQKVAVKTNLFYGAYSGTPNLGVEWGLSPRTTIELGAGLNWFTPNKASSNKKLVHWLGTMEYRYWTCERFSGHFGGIHIIGTQYNIAGHHCHFYSGIIPAITDMKDGEQEEASRMVITSFLVIVGALKQI